MVDEFRAVVDDPDLRQGDLFRWHDRNYQRPWKTYGVIITADCDLINKKTYGQLSYLPVLTMEDYLWTFWRPERFGQTLREQEAALESRINKILVRIRGAGSEISRVAASAWALRAGAEQLPKEIGLVDPGQIKDLQVVIRNYLTVRELIDSDTFNLGLLQRSYSLKNKRPPESHSVEFARELQNSIINLPGDVFYLSGIDGYEDFGLFTMLRHISQCSITDVAMSPAELRSGEAKAKRIARMNPPYVFSLAQCLARVFSDIGLPRLYDERRKERPMRYVESIWTDEK